MVRHNLKNCNKVLVSTPDILELARQYSEDAEYLPNPVDTQLFYPKPMPDRNGKLKVLIASNSDWNVKGTDMAIKALSQIKDQVDVSIIHHGKDFDRTVELAKSLGLNLHVLKKVPHEKMSEYYWGSEVVIDQFRMGSLCMITLEAIACGRPVLTFVSSKYPEYRDFPLKGVDTEEKIVSEMLDAGVKLWRKEYAYLEKNHKPEVIVEKLLNIYSHVIC